jgi:outer membrane murein-binding lipoprotein Lpp
VETAAVEITQLCGCISVDDFSSIHFAMPTIPQSIQTLFSDHQARLAAVSAASGVVGLSLDLDQISATYLSKAVQILVRPKYVADSNPGTSPEDKISKLASSVSRLAKQVRPLAPNDAFYGAFTSGSVAAAQDVFLSIFGLAMPN